jgi:hypothetical protein
VRTVHVELGAHDAGVATSVDGVVVHDGRVAYRTSPWGLSRWTDPEDGSVYVVASGALAGAADLLGEVPGPDDLMPTWVVVSGADAVVAPSPGALLAGHHLGFAAGPWRRHDRDDVTIHARRTLRADLAPVLVESRRALDWLLDWFGGPAPWGAAYAHVLLPDAPWLAMEHPGCVLLSERLLATTADRRMAVLAHEAAHQWLGNLVPPRSWSDLGVFEGLAELLGQLACRALLGARADPYLDHRRRAAPLVDLPGVDPRTLPSTAGLAEVAGPVQHAALLDRARADLGPDVFRARIQELVRRRAGMATSATDVWATLGAPPQEPVRIRLPAAPRPAEGSWPTGLRTPAAGDPATAVVRARRAFRGAGRDRVSEALGALADATMPAPVRVGLATELARGATREIHWHKD